MTTSGHFVPKSVRSVVPPLPTKSLILRGPHEPKVRDRAFHFISPHLPAGRGLSGKELHPGQVAHKGHDLFPGLVRLFAVGFNRGNDKLMDICRLPFGMALGSQQADFRISPRPEAKTIKPTVCLFILFQPDKGHRLIAEAPRLYEPQGLRELGESRPQKKCAVRGGQISHRERTQLVNPHCGIMVFCRPLYLTALVLPRGIGVNDRIVSDSHTPFCPALTASVASRMRSVAGA